MTFTLTDDFESGVDGNTVTVAGNVDQVQGSPTFEADAAFHGSMGVLMSGSGQAVRYVVTADHSGSIYVSPIATPGSSANLSLTWGTSANATNFHVRFHSDGTISISNASNSIIGAASTTTWTTGDTFRLDWQCDESAGFTTDITLRIFKNANIEGDTPDETLTRTTTTYAGSTSRLRVRSSVAGYTFWYDTLRLSTSLEWADPFDPPIVPDDDLAFWEWTGTEWVGPLVAQEWIP